MEGEESAAPEEVYYNACNLVAFLLLGVMAVVLPSNMQT
jgi:hypothetical protein